MKETETIIGNKRNWLLVLAIILFASTLRAPLTKVGPVIDEIKSSLHLNHKVAGMLTTIPLLMFAITSPLVSKLTARFTMSKTIFYAMITLMIGLCLRVVGGVELFLIGTLILGVAIAIGNVVLPSFVKWAFPLHIGIMTSLYSGTMNFTAGLGGGLSVPLASMSQLGYRLSLVFWVVFAVIAFVLWIFKLRENVNLEKLSSHEHKSKTNTATGSVKVVNSKVAWLLALMMGFQSMIFYSVVTWVPSILMSRGLSPSLSGYLLMMNQFAQVPMTIVFPIIASKIKDQRLMILIISALFIVGFSLFFTHSIVMLVLGMIISGLAMGAGFSLSMVFFSLRSRTHLGSIKLSGFGQSVGYLIAALGPFLIGYLYDVSGSWVTGICTLLLMAICFMIFGLGAAKDRVVEDE